jgi:hypothetical protein
MAIIKMAFSIMAIDTDYNYAACQWKGINRKQSTRCQHLSRLKASAFFSLQKIFSCYETQQLILGTGNAIWWVTEPHYAKCRHAECGYAECHMLIVVKII